MVRALFITRAQPFHKGHLHAIKNAIKRFDEVIVAIGSSNKKNTPNNPFSFEERKKMIEKSGVKCKIIGVPDVGNDKKWVKTILDLVDFDIVITGSPWVRRCFSNVKKVINPDFLEPDKYSGTKIREKILKGEKWEHLVPKETVKVIKNINGVERIKKLGRNNVLSNPCKSS
jgi:nicotinamide-nucleotide adenylyltransferase